METFELLDKDLEIKKTKWPDKEKAVALKKEFDGFREKTVIPAIKGWREFRHDKILKFLKPALSYYEEKKKKQSRLSFEDLLMLTAKLLKNHPEVRDYFNRKFTRILVDEFQDTDPIQAEVLFFITGKPQEEKDWRKIIPEPGSLFLVGDPKQSIYRFRRADIDTYNMVKNRIIESGGEALFLTANFRSLPSLRDWNNSVFKELFPKAAGKFQAAFVPLDSVRQEKTEALSGIFKITSSREIRHNQTKVANADAEVIGTWIQWAPLNRVLALGCNVLVLEMSAWQEQKKS